MDALMRKIEGLLFSWGESLSLQKLATITEAPKEDVKYAIQKLIGHYDTHGHALTIIEVNQSVQMATRPDLHGVIDQLFQTDTNKGLSLSNLEVLSIVAYKQPVTKQEIEQIRGVKSDRAMQQLIELGLVRISGKLERIGRPNLFSTTELFLKKFGLKKISDLPPITSFDKLQMALFDDPLEGGEDFGTNQTTDEETNT